MADFYALTVQNIKPLTPTSVAITFSIPKELIQTFNFAPGQYITIKKEVKGKELRRAYSISSSPKRDYITIGVKRVDKGGFSGIYKVKFFFIGHRLPNPNNIFYIDILSSHSKT